MIKTPQNIKGLIFDCDGTLVDTMPLHMEAWKKAFEINGRDFPHDFIDSLKGAPLSEIIQMYNEKFNDNLDLQKIGKAKRNNHRGAAADEPEGSGCYGADTVRDPRGSDQY